MGAPKGMATKQIAKLSARERIDSRSEWDPNTGCQIWAGTIDRQGYPYIQFRGKAMSAHRLSILDYLGLSSSPLLALHLCDTPACVNPEHLYLGSHRENMKDMLEKGRDAKKRTKTTITEEIRKSVQDLFRSGESKHEISRRIGISRPAIRSILNKEPSDGAA